MLFDSTNGKISISNHSLGYVVDCDTRAVLYALGYRDQPMMEAPAKCGIGLHDAFAEYLLTENKQAAIAKFTSSYRKWSDINVPQDDGYSYENVLKIISFWFDQNPLTRFPFTVIPELVEKSFEIPLLDDGSITFNGRPDAIVASRKNKNEIYIVDHKTVGFIRPKWLSGFEMDAQMSGYFYMAEQYGLDVKGIYINALEIKKLSDSQSTCPEHKVPRIQCAVRHVGYRLVPYSRNEENVKEWYRTAVSEAIKLRHILDKTPDIRYIRRQRQQGSFRKVCTNCGFFEFCVRGRDPDLAEKLLIKQKTK